MSALKRYNTDTSQWEYVAIGKQGPTGNTGNTGATGVAGPALANIDGGTPSSVYTGITSIDAGGV
jgi:hypothetical protein